MQIVGDISTQLATISPEKDETRKAEALKKFAPRRNESGPNILEFSFLTTVYGYGSKVTYVDFALYVQS